MIKENNVPHITKKDNVILFDGVCKLCNGWAKFIIKYDKKLIFKLVSVQSPQGKEILNHFDMPVNEFKSMVLVSKNQAYTKSTSFFIIVKHLPLAFRFVLVFRIIPRPIRDWLYDRIALNRYKLFGKHDLCLLPNPDHEHRFIK